MLYPTGQKKRIRNPPKTKAVVLEAVSLDIRSEVCEKDSGDNYGREDHMTAGYYLVTPFEGGKTRTHLLKHSVTRFHMKSLAQTRSSSFPLAAVHPAWRNGEKSYLLTPSHSRRIRQGRLFKSEAKAS